MKLTQKQICKILNMHYVPFKILNGRIYADSMIGGTDIFEVTVDMTHKSLSEVYEWLGY